MAVKYFGLWKRLWKIKHQRHLTGILPGSTYGSETWSLTTKHREIVKVSTSYGEEHAES